MKAIFIKSILALGYFSFCLSSCQEEKIPYFDSQYNAVRFNATKEYDAETHTYKGNYSFLDNPFAEYDEYELPLILVGNTSIYDRQVEYEIDEEHTSAPKSSYEIVESKIPANSLKGVIKIKMYNTEEIQQGASYTVKLQLKSSPDIGVGPKEYIAATLNWNNEITPPASTDRYIWATYNSLIKSSLAATNMTGTAYSSNALKTIVTALDWQNWDDMSAHPDLIQRPTYYVYKYLADYRLIMTDKSYEAFAAKLADYLQKYNNEHPDKPLVHNEGSLKGQLITARSY